METEQGRRIGAADLESKTIDSAPAAPTPAPQLALHRQDYVRPGTPKARTEVFWELFEVLSDIWKDLGERTSETRR
jgi:hypothetical protein